MKELLAKLLGLLLQMELKPKSGFGKTEIIWKDGEIAETNLYITIKTK